MLAVRTPQADASGGAADTCGSASASGSAFDRPAAAAPAALPTPHDFDTGTAGSRR
jgi:hypothetical protein